MPLSLPGNPNMTPLFARPLGLAEQTNFKARRFKDDYELEKKKRVRIEEYLKDAEDQIIKLQEHLRKLEEMLERITSKRPVPVRNQNNSPEMHASKKSKVEEVPANTGYKKSKCRSPKGSWAEQPYKEKR
jgi:hypothetical protein